MKVFTCTVFTGYYPVGTAAVMVASSALEAKLALETALTEANLSQQIDVSLVKELDLTHASVNILCDGNY